MSSPRRWLFVPLTLCLTACPDTNVGSVVDPTDWEPSTTGTTSTSGGGNSGADGADTTGGDSGSTPACIDQYDGNDSVSAAYELEIDQTDISVLELTAEVCDSGSDWFTFTAQCDAYFGFETRTTGTLTQGGTAGTDVNTYLYDAGALATPMRTTTPGGLQLHPMHAKLDAGTQYYVQIQHADSDPVPYSLRIYSFPDGQCSSGAYICEGNATAIAATESSCLVFPNAPGCYSSRTVTQSVDLPEVSDGNGGWVDGWVVHVDASEVRNVDAPTTAEWALIESRCEQACTEEWENIEAIDADCTNASAFTSITLRNKPSVPTRRLVESSVLDASGIFDSEALTCDIQDDCCKSFSSNICPFRPEKVSPGPEPSTPSPREQYELGLSGSSATVTGAMSSIALDGHIGFSNPKDDSGTRPVYLSELAFSTTSSTAVQVSCSDGTQAAVTIDSIEFELLQPAFGIRSGTSGLVGFPPGALVYKVSVDVTAGSTVTVERTAWNAGNALGVLTPTAFAIDLEHTVRVGCGAGTTDIDIDLDLDEGSVDEVPPSATLSVPTSMKCPGTLTLSATVSDADGDLDTTRWYIDDYLLGPAVTSIPVPSGISTFDVAVVACDERGGCSRDEQTVTCTS